jgi:hypothetical protein
MRAFEMQDGAEGDDAGGVNLVVGDVVVTLDVVEIDGVRNSRLLVKVA